MAKKLPQDPPPTDPVSLGRELYNRFWDRCGKLSAKMPFDELAEENRKTWYMIASDAIDLMQPAPATKKAIFGYAADKMMERVDYLIARSQDETFPDWARKEYRDASSTYAAASAYVRFLQ